MKLMWPPGSPRRQRRKLNQARQKSRKRFTRAINRAIEKQLIGMREIGAITYLWLLSQQPSEDDDF